jgi:arginyl-tRNA synthetase
MKELIINEIHKATKLNKKEIENLIEIPPSQNLGDYAFPCFILSKKLKKSPQIIAEDLKKKIKSKDFEKIETKGPYLNFFINKKKLIKQIIKDISKKDFGKINLGKGKVMIEFSQPNTHKAFHVGHIRGTSIGESISRIYEFLGNKVIRTNYSGDTGMHIAKWIWCYQKYHAKEKLQKDESWIASIYVDAVKRLENKELQEEVNEINRLIENKKDKKINTLWKKTRQLSIESWEKIYIELNTKFDKHYFESQVEKKGKIISQKLVKQKIAKISEGATIVDLKKYDLGVWVLLRQDGTVLYSAKDLALIEEKFKKYNLNQSINVVADEQNLHFKQLFKTLELMKFKNLNKFKHLSFGMVRLPHGKMSSRTGDNILYSDFIKEIIEYTKKRIKERSNNQIDKKALIISIAAIKYSMLKQSPNKTIIFKKEDALSFEGDTGPYLLYSYARANSILKKVKSTNTKIKEPHPNEIKLTKKLSLFPEIVLRTYKDLNPAHIANYSYQLAQTFNEFYHACPVINSENESLRIELVKSFKKVLKDSLNLLGIETLEEM